MTYRLQVLNGRFGACLDGATPADLGDDSFQARARELWVEHGGLLAIRGETLASLTPHALVAWSEVFGNVERGSLAARENNMVGDHPILRIGNTRDANGQPNGSFARSSMLESDDNVRYNPATRRPVWHTDSTFRKDPPIGTVFHCRQAPPEGGDTLFADTRAAYATLDASTREHLASLEAVCSLAHHDKKINRYSPDYPVLTPEQRAANPPNRVPVVLHHPVSGEPALYGLNSSTCAVVAKGASIDDESMDRFDLEGVEDDSVMVIRDLLPHITGPEFTVRWRWQPGDIVVWDNRSTIHAASGFNDERYEREMWRLTLVN